MKAKDTKNLRRCAWVRDDPEYMDYHDLEWGIPVHDDRKLFEMLILEGAQAGLSWLTILRKRAEYRKAFDNFNPEKIARYNQNKKRELLANAGIVRNKLKIESTITNAECFLEVREEFGSFDAYVWSFVKGKPIRTAFDSIRDIPPKTAVSDAMSRDMKKRGFKFVGSTICYAFMQAVGMVNDHTTDCFRHGK